MSNPYYDMGFRAPITTLPDSWDQEQKMDAAVRELTAALRGGTAHDMARFMRATVEAMGRHGYSVTYAVGPQDEFGLVILKTQDADSPDYAVVGELGSGTALRQMLDQMESTVPHPRQSEDSAAEAGSV